MNVCPMCNSRQIGKINRGRFFCGECCHEWTVETEGRITIYRITSEGTIVRLRKGNTPSVSTAAC